MAKYAVLLRGINTGGLSLKMSELQAQVAALCYREVKTILATGNIVLESNHTKTQVQSEISAALSAFMGKTIHCLVRSLEELQQLLSEADFESPDYHHYILFCDEALLAELQPLFLAGGPDENEALFGRSKDLHWIVKKGDTLGEFGGKTLGQRKYKSILTSRNLNTVKKLIAALNKL